MKDGSARQLREASREDAVRLLSSVTYGRIVFTERAMPAIRPVNHLVDDGDIIIRTHAGAAVLSSVDQVVAYEADVITDDDRLSWSVIAIGIARLERDPVAVARYERLLRPAVDLPMDHVIRIHPEIMTGQVLEAG